MSEPETRAEEPSAERSPVGSVMRFVFVVAVLTLVIDWTVYAVFVQVMDRSDYRIARIYQEGTRASGVVLGSSRSLRSLHPAPLSAEIGGPVLHLGFNAQSTQVSEALLGDFLERHEAPSIVFLEVSGLSQGPESLLALKPLVGRSERLRAAFHQHYPKLAVAADASRLYQLNAATTRNILYGALGVRRERWKHQRTLDEQGMRRLLAEPTRQVEPRPENLEALARMAASLGAAGVVFRPFVSPYLHEYLPRIPELAEVVEQTEEIAGVRVFDFSRSLERREWFADRVHHNEEGRLVLNRIMREAGFFALDGAGSGFRSRR